MTKHCRISAAVRLSRLFFLILATAAFVGGYALERAVAEEGKEKKVDLKHGARIYAVCSACHGKEGHGNQAIQAPALAGLTDWYIIEQVKKFQDGKRGSHPEDMAGLLMRPMARTMKSEEDLKAVAAYIAALEPKLPEITITDGDPEKGKTLYAVCVACHGDKLQGNEQLKTAPLMYANDWYQLAQLKKYKKGIRGADPSDAQALQMQAIMGGVPDEQTMKNIIAYVSQMAKQQAEAKE